MHFGIEPIEGAEQIAHFLVAITSGSANVRRLLERKVNNQPGLVAQHDGHTLAVYAFEIAGDQIARIWAVLNPDKLRHWSVR